MSSSRDQGVAQAKPSRSVQIAQQKRKTRIRNRDWFASANIPKINTHKSRQLDGIRLLKSFAAKLDPRTTNERQKTQDGWDSGITDNGKGLILSVNLKESATRLRHVLEYIGGLPKPPMAVLFQDPPIDLAYKSIPGYDRDWRNHGDELTFEDAPGFRPWEPPHKPNKAQANVNENVGANQPRKRLSGVAFLVHRSVKTWHVHYATGKNSNKHATLRIQFPSQSNIAIHNVYNRDKKLDIDELEEAIQTLEEQHIVAGDFNLHDRLWGGLGTSSDTAGKKLSDAMQINDMICENNPFDPDRWTYCRGEFSNSDALKSVVDLVFTQDTLHDHVEYELLKTVPGFESDHRPSQFSVKVDVPLPVFYKRLWQQMDKVRAEQKMVDLLKTKMGPPSEDKAYGNLQDAEADLQKLTDCLLEVVNEVVPVVPQYEQPKKPNGQGTQSANKNSSGNRRQQASQNKRPVNKTVKRAKRGLELKIPTYIQKFVYGDKEITSVAEQKDLFMNVVFPNGSKSLAKLVADSEETGDADPRSAAPSATALPPPVPPMPELGADNFEYESPQHLLEGELLEILGDLPNGKAAGPDTIAYDILKAVKHAIEPYLAPIFNMFLQHCHHPDAFKDTFTAAIPKNGKPLDQPKSYRPITIINCISKIYERVLANRFRTLVDLHPHMLPAAQYGAPGRSTALATERLVNFIHAQWMLGKKVTVYGLDLSGAYDNVIRHLLLKILAMARVPTWIVKTVRSFLSHRRTTVRFPGEMGDTGATYQVNVGVPQGSPLSSILFLFYAAVLLSEHKKLFSEKEVDAFAYIDDTNVAMASDSYRTNNERFEILHQKLLETGGPMNFKFSPEKYTVFHFLAPYRRSTYPYFERYLLPNIPAFAKLIADPGKRENAKVINQVCPEHLRVLGVIFDRRLSFIPHIKLIQKKVRFQMLLFRQTATATQGPTLEECRNFYMSNITSAFTYCASSWFIHHLPGEPIPTNAKMAYALSGEALRRLESIQYECLLTLSGARRGTWALVLPPIMGVPYIVDKLYTVAMRHRCSRTNSPEYDQMDRYRHLLLSGKPMSSRHPYAFLHQLATRYRETILPPKRTSEKLDKVGNLIRIKTHFTRLAVERSEMTWDYEVRKRRADLAMKRGGEPPKLEDHLAYTLRYGELNYLLKADLDRAQSTMAIYILTGNIPLTGNRKYHYQLKAQEQKRRIQEPNKGPDKDFVTMSQYGTECKHCFDNAYREGGVKTLEKRRQTPHGLQNTAEHRFYHCVNLEGSRNSLFRKTNGQTDMETLMTQQVSAATSWAIQLWGIQMFDGVKDICNHQFS